MEARLDRLLDLSEDDRRAAIPAIAGGDPALARELDALLDQIEAAPSRLDQPAIALMMPESDFYPGLAIGQLVGAYRVIALIGRGGMARSIVPSASTGNSNRLWH